MKTEVIKRVWPEVLTPEEAMDYLRLEITKKNRRTLAYYRESGLLKGVRIGRFMHYQLDELQRFVREQEAS